VIRRGKPNTLGEKSVPVSIRHPRNLAGIRQGFHEENRIVMKYMEKTQSNSRILTES
jgi:hypothetical protein